MSDKIALDLYKQNPAELNKQCRDRWQTWFDSQFRDKIKENLELYNNYSQDLADRKADEDGPVRACLFISVICPSVLSRVGYMRQITFNVPDPISVEAEDENDQLSVENAPNVKLLLNKYLNNDEFKTLYLQKLLIQELYPIGFYFISEFEEEKKVLKILPQTENVAPQAPVNLGNKKQWQVQKKQWRPKVDVYTQENIAYDPYATRWADVTYITKICHLTLGELVSRKNPPYSYKFIGEDKETELGIDEFKNLAEKATKDDFRVQTDDQKKTDPGELTQRYIVLENFVKIEQEDGSIETRIITSTGKVTLKDREFPYKSLDITDICFPYIGYPVLNQIEGICTADLLKYPQHAINDAFNMRYDADSYDNFTPELKDTRAKIVSEGRMGPGSIKDVDMTSMPQGTTVRDVMAQIYQRSPSGPETLALLNLLFERCDIVASPPQSALSQGAGNPQETATKTISKVQGASSRLSGIHILSHVEEFKKFCNSLWLMTLERLQLGDKIKVGGKDLTVETLMGAFVFDMPYLSGLADRVEKERQFTEFFTMTAKDPLMAHPRIHYEMLKILAKYKNVDNFDKIVPEELVVQMEQMLKQIPPQPTAGGGMQNQITQ